MGSKTKRWTLILLFASLAVSLGDTAYADIYGRIRGLVRDKKSHEPLVGAIVRVEGTNLGALTDVKGEYVILKVPPNVYSVKVSYVGYSGIEVKNVTVVQDNASEINVDLEESAVDIPVTLVEVARVPLIRQDVSASQVTVSAQDIKNRPTESIQSTLSTLPGVSTFNGQFYVRGARATEVQYIVDGIPVTNPINNTLMIDINKDAVQDVSVQTGGFSAEYGNALGGIMNVTTKDGGPRLGGSLRYMTDKPLTSTQLYNNQNIWDATFGGPLFEPVHFFLTGYLNTQDLHTRREVIAPDGTNLGRAPHAGAQNYKLNAKLKVPVGSSIELHLLGSLDRNQSQNYSPYWQFGSDPNQLDRLGATFDKARYVAASLDHTVSDKAFYTLTVGYLDYDHIQGELDRSQWSGNQIGISTPWTQDFKFRTPFLNTDYHIPGNPGTYSKWQWRDSQGPADVLAVRSGDSVSVNNPYGVPGGILNTIDADYFQNFVYAGDNDFYEHDKNRQLSARFDLTTQFSTDHELKAGFEIVQQRVNRFVIGGMGTFNGVGVSYPVIDFYEKSPGGSGLSVTDGNDLGTGYTPITTAAYVQYQLRYQGMYINLGLRYDHYNARTEYRINPIDPSQADPFLQARAFSEPESQLSPRVGIAFPITDRIVLRFNYGQFFSRPSMTSMFSHLWNNFNQADVNQGNPNIAAQRTTSYELGLSWLLRDDLAFDATAFNKSMFYLEGYREVLGPNLRWFFQDQNKEYGNSYGAELSLRKRYGDWVSGTLNYTLSYANGTSSDVSELSRYPITAATFAKSLGYQPLYPEDLRPMAFDRRHVVNLVLDFNVPIGEGPDLFGSKVLSGFGINLTGNYQSGTPYTPLTSFFMTLTSDQYNSASFPATASFDMRIHKDFLGWSGIKIGIFANIYNVFNLNTPFAVFKGSGNADSPMYLITPGAISPESYPSTSPLYSKVADSNHDGILSPQERFAAYQRLQQDMLGFMPNYALPRRALFGIELSLE